MVGSPQLHHAFKSCKTISKENLSFQHDPNSGKQIPAVHKSQMLGSKFHMQLDNIKVGIQMLFLLLYDKVADKTPIYYRYLQPGDKYSWVAKWLQLGFPPEFWVTIYGRKWSINFLISIMEKVPDIWNGFRNNFFRKPEISGITECYRILFRKIPVYRTIFPEFSGKKV